MTVTHGTDPRRAPLKARRDDLYETPPEATRALLRVENFDGVIWEPACGKGGIVTVLREHGYEVLATDLVDYDFPTSQWGLDFLMEPKLWGTSIVTNPPFKLADQFVSHALALGAAKVVMLLRLAFLESTRRTRILENAGLARVHVFRNRLPFMHRDGWEGPKTTSATAYAWFVWDKRHRGPTELHRLSWETTK